MSLLIFETHPVQYHAPVYRHVSQHLGVRTSVLYGSDHSLANGLDKEFGVKFSWDTDLLSGYESAFIPKDQRNVSILQLMRLMSAEIQRVQPKACMVLGYSNRFDRAALLAAVASGLPLLFRGEVTDHAQNRSLLKRFGRDTCLRLFYRRVSGCLYIGTRALNHYHRLGCPDEKLVHSPYCVDSTPFRPADAERESLRKATRAALQIAEGAQVMVYSGKLSYRKGVDLLPEAIQQLEPEIRERIVLLLVGSGELENEIRQRAQALGLNDRIRFAGFQNQTALTAFYHAADYLILPSRFLETWGLVVNEALLHGLPCIATTSVGCVPDLIVPGETGETCVPDSAPALAEAIRRIQPLLNSEASRERCRNLVSAYSVARAAEGLANAYSKSAGANAAFTQARGMASSA